MKIRSIILVVLIISLQIPLSGCSYVAYKTYYSNVDDYATIWELAGFRHGYEGASTFFPEDIEDLTVNYFYCRYDECLPLGDGIQIFLEIQYDQHLFPTEVERIKASSFECSEDFQRLELLAYATRMKEDSAWEYALIEEEQQIIRYIYIQAVPKDEIEFDHQFLPDDYEWDLGLTRITRNVTQGTVLCVDKLNH